MPDAKLTPVKINVFAANGTRVDILGTMRISFAVSGIDVTADLLISDDAHEFMLGTTGW